MSHALSSPQTKHRQGKVPRPPRGHYLLRLYIVGNGPNSKQALTNLRSICETHLKGRYTIETVDVVKNFAAAAQDNILITPALVLIAPQPRVVVLGNLSDPQKVMFALRLLEADP
ncbi:MAG: circadian clock KaiB family protein [Phycisphaerae bacterium]